MQALSVFVHLLLGRLQIGGALRVSVSIMPKTFKRGDHVEWNSEAGIDRGVIFKKIVSDVRVNGYVHQASKKEPQYFIKSYKTDHLLHRALNE
jgi:hypothetical protein